MTADIVGYSVAAALTLIAIVICVRVLEGVADITSGLSVVWAGIIDEHFPIWAAILMFVLVLPTFVVYLAGRWCRASVLRHLNEDATLEPQRPAVFSVEYWKALQWNPLPPLRRFYTQPKVRSGTLIWLTIFAGQLGSLSTLDSLDHMRAGGISVPQQAA